MTSSKTRAPRVFISYSYDSSKHIDKVLELSNKLRNDGIDCEIDQYYESPDEGWPRWMINQIKNSDYVIQCWTELYKRRFEGEEKGKGSEVEGKLITQEYLNEGKRNKYIPVVFSSQDLSFIPTIFADTTHYNLSMQGEYEKLYRRLSGQPSVKKPELGKLISLPPRERKQAFLEELPENVAKAMHPLLIKCIDRTPIISSETVSYVA